MYLKCSTAYRVGNVLLATYCLVGGACILPVTCLSSFVGGACV